MKGKLYGILTVLIVLCVALAFGTADPWWNLKSSKFLNPDNIENLISRISMYGILGIGIAFVIITSGVDLSVGSTVCLCGVLLSMMLKVDYSPTESAEVTRIDAQTRSVHLTDVTDQFQPGMGVRYTGGVGAGKLLSIESVTEADGHSVIVVREDLGRDETGGRLVPVGVVSAVTAANGSASVTMASATDAAVNDQLQLVRTDGGVSNQKITAVHATGNGSLLTLERDPGERYHQDVGAVVLKRHQRASIPVAIITVLLTAAGLGLIHGLLVTQAKLPSFVVTLCALLIYRGVSRWLTSDNPAGFGELQSELGPVAVGRLGIVYRGDEMVFGIPYPFFLLTGIGIVAAVFLGRTIWGRYLLALGRNEEAARFSGINTNRVTLVAYVICSVLASVGGMLLALNSNSISPSNFGNSDELYAIAAAVLGGCSLRGGEGSILGVIIGTAVMQVLKNSITLLQLPQPLELAIIGAVILIGVLSDELVRRAAAKRRLRQSV